MADPRIPANERVNGGITNGTTANRSNALAFSANTTGGSSASSSSANSQFVENPLNKCISPSYHWQFGVGKDIGDDAELRVIFAETGLSTFNITDVEMRSVVGPDFQTQNTQSVEFTITIIEPLGMQLQDKFVAATTYLGNNNLLKAPYLLTLRFQGYDEDGAPTDPVGQQWKWKLNILTFDATLDTTGAKYIITAVGNNMLAHFNDNELIRTPMTLDVSKKEPTIGEVMKALQKEINDSLAKSHNVANGGVVPFKVVIDDRPYQNPVKGANSPFEHKFIRDQKHLDGQHHQAIMQIAKGTDLSKIIDYIMSASETATAMANPNESATENDAETKEFTSLHRIETRITNDSYNTKIQDYLKTITYTIISHDTVRPITSPKGQDDAKANGAKKLSFLRNNNLLKKEYQYLFTGKNTEVLDFNISLNFQFVTVQNAMSGYFSSEVARPGRQFDPDNFNKQTKNTQWAKVSPGLTPITYCAAPLDTSSSTPTSTVDLLDSLGGKKTVLAEDLSNYSAYWPTTIVQTGQGTTFNVNQSVEATNYRTRSIYGEVINQVYGTDANLMDITLEIRGDPYWLGTTNLEDFMTKPSDDKASFALGEHAFMLRFVVPQGVDADGAPVLVPSNAFTGYYTAQKITHKFSRGQFTQSIQGIRIQMIDALSSN